MATAVDRLGGIDVLVNNAGNLRAGELESSSQSDIEAMVDVDLLAPILLTRAALPAPRGRTGRAGPGIASGIALVGLPFYTVYAAVKAGSRTSTRPCPGGRRHRRRSRGRPVGDQRRAASRRGMQDLNRIDVAAVDEALRPGLAQLRDAVSDHRAM